MIPLNTTSYAILGQLALRDWSTYELAREVRRNLHYSWPRAESHIYTEARRLGELHLAHAVTSTIGRRRRITYSITDAGRDALQAWLACPPKPISLEFESLLRVLLSPVGTKQQLLSAIDQAERDVQQLVDEVRPRIAREYLEGRAPFQQHVHVRAFIFDFLTDYGLVVRRWAERTRAEVVGWDDVGAGDKSERALEIIATAAHRDRPA
jgi:PadR family transcriptional regulator, regulatory protein AphA